MKIDDNPYFVITLAGWMVLVFGAFMNVFVRWAAFGIRLLRLSMYLRTCDSSIPIFFSPVKMDAIRRYMLRVKTLQDPEMESLRQKLVAAGTVKGIVVAVWVFAGIYAVGLGVMALLLKLWPLGIAAVGGLLFFVIFAVVIKYIMTSLVGDLDPR